MWKGRRASSMPSLNGADPDITFYSLQRSSSLNYISPFIRRLKAIHKRKNERAKLTMAERLEKVAPYNIFFNCLPLVPATFSQANSIELVDLLCPSLGKLKCSLHICFVVEIKWLYFCYKSRGLSDLPLTVVQGSPITVKKLPPNVTCKYVEVEDAMGCHDTKMAIFVYDDESVRISVGSVNPVTCDWKYVNQGIWVSPRCPKLDDSRSDIQGESPTGFKKNLLDYLNYYNEECLTPYINYVRRANFSEVKVFFIYSAPGIYSNPRNSKCHLYQVGNALSRFCKIPDQNPSAWKVVAQSPTVGFLQQKPRETISYYGLLSRTLSKHTDLHENERTVMNIIYPSVNNVLDAFEIMGSKLGYMKNFYDNQIWLNKYMLQWKTDAYNRTKVIPHMRCYFRISHCSKKLAFFLLTSANLARSGWGVPNTWRGRETREVYIRNYDVGVLFLPKFFGEEYFEIQDCEDRQNAKLLPFMFNLPLVPYEPDDVPWLSPIERYEDSDSDSSVTSI